MSRRSMCSTLALSASLAASLLPGTFLVTGAGAQSLVGESARTIESGDDTTAPALAFDTSRNRHLVVYQRRGTLLPFDVIRARLLDAAGRPVGSEFEVASQSGPLVTPAVAYNPAIDEYLVVYVNTRIAPRVVAQRVAGGSLALVGSPFAVSDITELWQSAFHPAVAANPLAGAASQWMVTWSDNRRAMTDPNNYRVYGALLTTAGQRPAPTILMTDQTSVSDTPSRSSVAFSPRSNQYVVLFNDPGKPSASNWIAQVDATTASVIFRGAVNGGEPGTQVCSQGIVYSPWARSFLTSWVRQTGTDTLLTHWTISWEGGPYNGGGSSVPASAADSAANAASYGGALLTSISLGSQNTGDDDLDVIVKSVFPFYSSAAPWTDVGVAPVGNDSHQRFASNLHYGTTLAVWQHEGQAGDHDLRAARILNSTYPVVSASADVDADGTPDHVVVRLEESGALAWYVRKSGGGATGVTWGAVGDVPVAGDYDGDGRTDLAVWRPADGGWYVIPSGTGVAYARAFGSGAAGDQPVPADYDGDGHTDLAVYRPGQPSAFFVVRSSDNVAYAVAWGSLGDVPVTGDYDGDGRTDLAVWRPVNATYSGAFYIVPSGGGPAFGYAWGALGDVPVAGDFDGDGKDDQAVYRPITGFGSPATWFYVGSATGASEGISWGIMGDIPVPADYDHDGRTDVAVWRPGAPSAFYILRSGSTATAVAWGERADLPIAR